MADKDEEVKGGEESILKIMEKAEGVFLVVDGDYCVYMEVSVSFILRRGDLMY